MTAQQRFLEAIGRHVRMYGEVTAKDLRRLLQRADARLEDATRVSHVPRGARCDRCRRRLTAKVIEVGGGRYGEKCAKIVKEAVQ